MSPGSRIVLLRTEGRGGEAEIELDGARLRVVDGWSAADAPAAPGPVEDGRIEVVANPRQCGPCREDPAPEKGLTPIAGWRYRGEGEITSLDPLRVDLGPFAVVVALAPGEDWAPGDRLTLAIDRIVLSRAKAKAPG